MNYTSKYLLLILTILFSTNKNFAAGVDGVNMVTAAGGLFLSGAAKWAVDECSKKPRVIRFSKSAGVSPKDVGNVISISGGLLSLSLLANKETAQGMKELSYRAPIAAAVAGIICTQTFQKIAEHVPVIGSAIKCSNEHCTGICNDCKLTKISVAIGLYRILDYGLQAWLNSGK